MYTLSSVLCTCNAKLDTTFDGILFTCPICKRQYDIMDIAHLLTKEQLDEYSNTFIRYCNDINVMVSYSVYETIANIYIKSHDVRITRKLFYKLFIRYIKHSMANNKNEYTEMDVDIANNIIDRLTRHSEHIKKYDMLLDNLEKNGVGHLLFRNLKFNNLIELMSCVKNYDAKICEIIYSNPLYINKTYDLNRMMQYVLFYRKDLRICPSCFRQIVPNNRIGLQLCRNCLTAFDTTTNEIIEISDNLFENSYSEPCIIARNLMKEYKSIISSMRENFRNATDYFQLNRITSNSLRRRKLTDDDINLIIRPDVHLQPLFQLLRIIAVMLYKCFKIEEYNKKIFPNKPITQDIVEMSLTNDEDFMRYIVGVNNLHFIDVYPPIVSNTKKYYIENRQIQNYQYYYSDEFEQFRKSCISINPTLIEYQKLIGDWVYSQRTIKFIEIPFSKIGSKWFKYEQGTALEKYINYVFPNKAPFNANYYKIAENIFNNPELILSRNASEDKINNYEEHENRDERENRNKHEDRNVRNNYDDSETIYIDSEIINSDYDINEDVNNIEGGRINNEVSNAVSNTDSVFYTEDIESMINKIDDNINSYLNEKYYYGNLKDDDY